MYKHLLSIICLMICMSCAQQPEIEWISTTQESPWMEESTEGIFEGSDASMVEIYKDSSRQTIDGFGAAFNELGWTSLSKLDSTDREKIFKELFEPGAGANFTICRVPLGANDFSREWYSYNETEGDFEMENFSIQNDYETLIPFIQKAQSYNPSLKIWASPWSPPTWMKTNKHYALAKMPDYFGEEGNGIKESQLVREGENAFIQEEKYLEAYALYFSRFIEAYNDEDIPFFMVMPQNEFNSAQWFPSATWTPRALARFIHHLGPAMEFLDVDIFFGTMERPDPQLFETFYQDSVAREYVEGIGFQWAGKESVGAINDTYPDLKIYQTEHECGNGENSWDYAVYGWDLMKHYFLNGTNAYMYWNMSLLKDGVSTWGWRQNSLVTVDEENKTYQFTNDYHMMKHVSHFVQPGAVLLETSSFEVMKHRDDVLGFWEGELDTNEDNLLAFKNPDESIVVVMYNDGDEEKPVHLKVGDVSITPTLKPASFNTLLIN